MIVAVIVVAVVAALYVAKKYGATIEAKAVAAALKLKPEYSSAIATIKSDAAEALANVKKYL